MSPSLQVPPTPRGTEVEEKSDIWGDEMIKKAESGHMRKKD